MQQDDCVLLVEDDLIAARAIQRVLAQHGMEVHHLATAGAAKWLQRSYAIGVFDIDLPDGDGVQLASRLLASHVVGRAVFHTGSTDERQLESAGRLGAVCKKGTSSSLLQAVTARDARAPVPARSGVAWRCVSGWEFQ